MRVESLKRLDKGIIGKDARVLLVQEQRQPVGLVAVQAVITATSSGRNQGSRHKTAIAVATGLRKVPAERPQTSVGSFPASPEAYTKTPRGHRFASECVDTGSFRQRQSDGLDLALSSFLMSSTARATSSSRGWASV